VRERNAAAVGLIVRLGKRDRGERRLQALRKANWVFFVRDVAEGPAGRAASGKRLDFSRGHGSAKAQAAARGFEVIVARREETVLGGEMFA